MSESTQMILECRDANFIAMTNMVSDECQYRIVQL